MQLILLIWSNQEKPLLHDSLKTESDFLAWWLTSWKKKNWDIYWLYCSHNGSVRATARPILWRPDSEFLVTVLDFPRPSLTLDPECSLDAMHPRLVTTRSSFLSPPVSSSLILVFFFSTINLNFKDIYIGYQRIIHQSRTFFNWVLCPRSSYASYDLPQF